MHHLWLSLTAAPLRRTHAACRREGGQAPSALLIPAEPPPLLARGAHFIHGPFQHQETSFRAPGGSLCTLNGGDKGVSSLSIHLAWAYAAWRAHM